MKGSKQLHFLGHDTSVYYKISLGVIFSNVSSSHSQYVNCGKCCHSMVGALGCPELSCFVEEGEAERGCPGVETRIADLNAP